MRMTRVGQGLAAAACAAALSLGCLAGCGAPVADGQATDDGQEQAATSAPTQDEASATDEASGQDDATPTGDERPLTVRLAGSAAQGTVDCGQFTFEIPAYWAGKVAVSVDYEGFGPVATITLPDDDQAVLATLSLLDGDEAQSGGDIGSHLAGSVADGNGSHVEVWTYNWPWLVANDAAGSLGVSDDELATLVDLATGGLLDVDALADEDEETVNGAEYGFSAAELVPTVAFG